MKEQSFNIYVELLEFDKTESYIKITKKGIDILSVLEIKGDPGKLEYSISVLASTKIDSIIKNETTGETVVQKRVFSI